MAGRHSDNICAVNSTPSVHQCQLRLFYAITATEMHAGSIGSGLMGAGRNRERRFNLKKTLLVMSMVAVFLFSIAAIGFAETSDGTTLGFTATVKKNNTAVTATPLDLDSASYDLGFVGLWKLTYSGNVNITTNSTNPSWSLQGNLKDTGGDNFIWQYYYSDDNVDDANDISNWTCVGSLLNVKETGSGSWDGKSSDDITYGPTINARWLRLDYSATLKNTSGTGSVTAHGTGVMDVSSVPEPGTILAACTILAPAGMFFRRRKR